MFTINENSVRNFGSQGQQKTFLIALKLDPQNLDYVLDAAEFYARHGLVQRCRTFLDRAQAIELRNPRALAIRKAIKGK